MRLNAVEKALVNNPVRRALQRHFEAERLLAMGGPMHGGHALEIGCGRGVGVELILDVFGADRADAFDLDPAMVARARQRLARRGSRARVWVGDAERIAAADEAYDAVFDFGVIHHVPRWRAALSEVARVMRPGARLYASEVLARLVLHPFWRRVLRHPTEDRFDRRGFVQGIEEAGLRVIATEEILGSFAWVVAEKA
jgi:ubiquinone/menaquinone biosynthesis C-methylase UbiE